MKTANLRTVKEQLSTYVDESQRDPILILRHGRPAALVCGVEGYDVEQVLLMADPRFWQLIQRRRKQKSLPWSATKK
jgi:prevent-host-death family protein